MASGVLYEVHDDNPEWLGDGSLPMFVLSSAGGV
jgi:hypothetical protein